MHMSLLCDKTATEPWNLETFMSAVDFLIEGEVTATGLVATIDGDPKTYCVTNAERILGGAPLQVLRILLTPTNANQGGRS